MSSHSLRVSDFSFSLPEELIAAYPLPVRDSSRLMKVNRKTGEISLGSFTDLETILQPGDLLVLNDTRVLPARVLGHKDSGGRVEVFMISPYVDEGPPCWKVMLRSSKPCKAGQKLHLPNGIEAFVEERLADQEWLLRFPFIDVVTWLERAGSMPIPPYLTRGADSQDQERYQTVYARESGAVAAPTAGLHFTTELLDRLRGKNVSVATVTLHVGLGTFQPVRTEFVADHRIHRERFTVSAETVDAIARTKQAGGRVVAVGTTSCRTLEYLASQRDGLRAADGEADIFIYPGYQFKVVDMLLTNFHLPESTLIMLVSAFAGHDLTLRAYQQAISAQMRFYSYGDAMVIYEESL